MEMEKTVLYEIRKQTAIVRINRPRVHNSIDAAVMSRLEEIIADLNDRNEIISVILTAAGSKSFCAGGDLKYFATFKTPQQVSDFSRRLRKILESLSGGRRFVIAAINGLALGGGCEILTACHYRIAAEHARFSFRQAANGILTGLGGGPRLFQLVGRSKALRLLLTSDRIDAPEALKIGFVDEVVPTRELLPAALNLSNRIAQNPLSAVRAFLKMENTLYSGEKPSLPDLEIKQFVKLWFGNDFQGWLRAFLKKGENSEENF